MNYIVKTMKSLEDLGVSIGRVTETIKHEIKNARRRISWSFISTFSPSDSAKLIS